MRNVSVKRALSDLVSLVRHAAGTDGELVPYPDLVRARYQEWLQRQEASGRRFTDRQRWWLDHIAEHIGVNLTITPEDFDYGEFGDRGGRVRAALEFGRDWTVLLDELNMALAA